MKPVLLMLTLALLLPVSPCQAGFFDELPRTILPTTRQGSSLDTTTVVKGLKEALATGTERAVASVAQPDGYFGNQLIKIMLPERLQQAANLLRQVGYQQQVDALVLSMNRAAEQAAPRAASFFGEAIREMTVEDARAILQGGDTAATRFFEDKTRERLFTSFKPSVSKSMDQLGTARAYKEMIGKYETLPLVSLAAKPSLDLDSYVTNKALDGLFRMVAEEEKKIRTNPAARTTELLRTVFGGR